MCILNYQKYANKYKKSRYCEGVGEWRKVESGAGHRDEYSPTVYSKKKKNIPTWKTQKSKAQEHEPT